jgi:hypothetical protein
LETAGWLIENGANKLGYILFALARQTEQKRAPGLIRDSEENVRFGSANSHWAIYNRLVIYSSSMIVKWIKIMSKTRD